MSITNKKRFFRYVQRKRNRNKRVRLLLNKDGQLLVSGDKENAELFNSYIFFLKDSASMDAGLLVDKGGGNMYICN